MKDWVALRNALVYFKGYIYIWIYVLKDMNILGTEVDFSTHF